MTKELTLIGKIAARAVAMAEKHHWVYDKFDATMDIDAAHNACPLDLDKLLNANDGTFGHDVFGIRKYLNRETGELTECFMPRCARPEKS